MRFNYLKMFLMTVSVFMCHSFDVKKGFSAPITNALGANITQQTRLTSRIWEMSSEARFKPYKTNDAQVFLSYEDKSKKAFRRYYETLDDGAYLLRGFFSRINLLKKFGLKRKTAIGRKLKKLTFLINKPHTLLPIKTLPGISPFHKSVM